MLKHRVRTVENVSERCSLTECHRIAYGRITEEYEILRNAEPLAADTKFGKLFELCPTERSDDSLMIDLCNITVYVCRKDHALGTAAQTLDQLILFA